MSDQKVGLLYGDFGISSSQNLFKQSSTSLLAITFILFVGYAVAKFLIHKRSSTFGTGKQEEAPKLLLIITKVIEIDLAPSMMLFFMIMGMGQFFVVAAVFAYLTIACAGVLVIGYLRNNSVLIKIFRILLVAFTIACFLNGFIDNMQFSDAAPAILQVFINGGQSTDNNN